MTVAPWLVACVLIVLSVPLTLDLKRRPERRPLRATAGMVALAALGAAGLRPQSSHVIESGRTLLATRGTDGRSFRRVLRDGGPWREVFRMEGVDFSGAGVLAGGIGYLTNRGVTDTLVVVGDGLRSWEWEQYRGEVVSRPPVLPSSRRAEATDARRSIVDLTWDREVRLGGGVPIYGRLDGGSDSVSVAVVLYELGEAVDTAETHPDGRFEFRYFPREVGRRVLEIGLAPGVDAERRARRGIGVSVVEPTGVRVLMLEGSPTFETRYLKEWLGRRGASVAVRSTISEGRYRSEYVNMERVALDPVTRGLVAGFDLVVADARTWRALGSRRGGVSRAVREDGVGMLFLPDAPYLDSPVDEGSNAGTGAFRAQRIADLDTRTVRPWWIGSGNDSLALLTALPFEIVPAVGLQPVVRDQLGAVLVAARAGAGGTVTMTLIGDTYRWALQDRAAEYGSLWAHLLDVTLGGSQVPGWRVAARGPVFVGDPVELLLSGAVDPTGAIIESPGGAESPLPLAQDEYESDGWSGRFWPTEPGWHVVTVAGSDEFWFHVNDRGDWEGLQRALARLETLRRAQLHPAATDAARRERTDPIPMWWFFLAFCLGAGVLWVEPRI